MDEETVIDPTLDPSDGEPESPKSGQDKSAEKPAESKELRAMQAQIDQQNKRIQELSDSERYWHEQARRGAEPDPDEDEDQDDEDDDDEPPVHDDKPEAFVDALSSKGVQALVERGVLTKKEAKALIAKEAEKAARKVANEVVGRERQKLTTDAELMSKYPQLQDKSSLMFAKTSEIFKAMVARNPAKAKDPDALLDAAERAKLSLEIDDLKANRGRRDDDPNPAERNRQDRIRAQSADRGRRGGEFEDTDDRLGPEARDVIRQMGLTEDQFLESRKRLGMGRSR